MGTCTVVVCSNDKYEDTWYPFFTVLKDRWKDNPFPIVLNTESKTFSMPGILVRTLHLYKPEERVQWGKRLKDTLRSLDSEYVIILLEDFFLERDVDTQKVLQCISWMDQDPGIACFNFYKTQCGRKKSKYPDFMQRKQFSQYRFNAQACLWRRKDLIHFIRNDEDPWVWEAAGNCRSFRIRKKFYCCADNAKMAFEYHLPGIVRGKWNAELVEPIVRPYGIKLDYSKRPKTTAENVIAHTNARKEIDTLYKLRVAHGYIHTILNHPKSLFFDE